VKRGYSHREEEPTAGSVPRTHSRKLQGSKDLTVQAVDSRVNEIFTSDGIKIIHATPESGRVFRPTIPDTAQLSTGKMRDGTIAECGRVILKKKVGRLTTCMRCEEKAIGVRC
jgi:hypothetical protein